MAYQPVFPSAVGNTCGPEPNVDDLGKMDAFTTCALQRLEKHCETNKCRELNMFKTRCQALADIRPDIGGFLPDKPFQSSYLYKKCNYCAFKHFMDDEGFDQCVEKVMFHPLALNKAERAQATVITSILDTPSSETCMNYRKGPLFDTLEAATTACNASGTCVYDKDGCRKKVCSDRENEADCNAHLCEWNAEYNRCYEMKCEQYKTGYECMYDTTCTPKTDDILLYKKTWNEPTKSFYYKSDILEGDTYAKLPRHLEPSLDFGADHYQKAVLVGTKVLQRYEHLKHLLVQTVRTSPPDMNKIQSRLDDLEVFFEPYFDTTDFKQHYTVEKPWFVDVNVLKEYGLYPFCKSKKCSDTHPDDCEKYALKSSGRYHSCYVYDLDWLDTCEEVTCGALNSTPPPPYNVSCESAFDERVTGARCITKDQVCVEAECSDMSTKEECDSMNRQGQRKLTMPACSWKGNTCQPFDCQDHDKAPHPKVLCQTDDRCKLVGNHCKTKKTQ